MKRRNPLLAGLINMLIPGSSHLYVTNNWPKFILFLFVNGAIIFVMILLGTTIQKGDAYTLPQGVCTGGLLVGVFAILFYKGMKLATDRNGEIDSAAHYQSMRPKTATGDPVARLANLQRQRDEGLISSEQLETKEAEIKSRKD